MYVCAVLSLVCVHVVPCGPAPLPAPKIVMYVFLFLLEYSNVCLVVTIQQLKHINPYKCVFGEISMLIKEKLNSNLLHSYFECPIQYEKLFLQRDISKNYKNLWELEVT